MSLMGYDFKDALRPLDAIATAHRKLAAAEERKADALERIADALERQGVGV